MDFMTHRLRLPLLLASLLLCGACKQTHHPVLPQAQPSVVATPARPISWAGFMAQLEQPGPLVLEKHIAATWEVPRSGLINLDHPTAQAAKLKGGPEPIHVYFYSLEHPKHGGFLIDSGVSVAFETGQDVPVRFPIKGIMHLERLKVHLNTTSYLASRDTPVRGVFLTHLHLDHIMGLKDIPKTVPLFVGPDEAEDRRFTHWFDRSTTEANLAGFGPLRTWRVQRDPEAPFAFVDVFGDGSALGLHAPGHTQGNMAFLLRTIHGPVLIAGDSSHTAWGWEHSVEPGSFNTDTELAAQSLDHLIELAQAHPRMTVHLGHQMLHQSEPAPTRAAPSPSATEHALLDKTPSGR